jgi:predicted nuclease of predicted toxin-antitoxin system
MKLLVDMNLSQDWVPLLSSWGWEVVQGALLNIAGHSVRVRRLPITPL